VVVSSTQLHRESIDIVILAVTTQHRAASSLEVSISAWKSAGLLMPSVIKPVFATIERSMILRRLGGLDPADLDALADALPKMLG
jgi:mRNA interferase MazF